MNRLTSLILVAALVACTDRTPTQTTPAGIAAVPPTRASVTTVTPKFFKYQDKNSAWHCLTHRGDSIIANGWFNNYTWRERGVAKSSTDTGYFKVDTMDEHNGIWAQGKNLNTPGGGGYSFLFWVSEGGNQLKQYPGIRLDSIDATYRTWWTIPSASYVDDQDAFGVDDHDPAQFDVSTTGGSCVSPTPTSVTLSNAVQYAKITWSNNGGDGDSTQVWFGDVNNPTLVETVAPGITQAFESWLSGSHQYQAKVRHVFGAYYQSVQSAYGSSNLLTH